MKEQALINEQILSIQTHPGNISSNLGNNLPFKEKLEDIVNNSASIHSEFNVALHGICNVIKKIDIYVREMQSKQINSRKIKGPAPETQYYPDSYVFSGQVDRLNRKDYNEKIPVVNSINTTPDRIIVDQPKYLSVTAKNDKNMEKRDKKSIKKNMSHAKQEDKKEKEAKKIAKQVAKKEKLAKQKALKQAKKDKVAKQVDKKEKEARKIAKQVAKKEKLAKQEALKQAKKEKKAKREALKEKEAKNDKEAKKAA